MWHIIYILKVLERYQNQIVNCFRTLLPGSRISLSWAGCSQTSGVITQKEEMDAFVPLFCLIHTCAWMHLWYIFRTVLQVSMDQGGLVCGVCIIWQKKLWRKAKLAFVPRHKPFIPAAWQSIPPLRCKLTPYESWTMTFFFFLVRELNVTWLHQESENMFNFSKRSDGWT